MSMALEFPSTIAKKNGRLTMTLWGSLPSAVLFWISELPSAISNTTLLRTCEIEGGTQPIDYCCNLVLSSEKNHTTDHEEVIYNSNSWLKLVKVTSYWSFLISAGADSSSKQNFTLSTVKFSLLLSLLNLASEPMRYFSTAISDSTDLRSVTAVKENLGKDSFRYLPRDLTAQIGKSVWCLH